MKPCKINELDVVLALQKKIKKIFQLVESKIVFPQFSWAGLDRRKPDFCRRLFFGKDVFSPDKLQELNVHLAGINPQLIASSKSICLAKHGNEIYTVFNLFKFFPSIKKLDLNIDELPDSPLKGLKFNGQFFLLNREQCDYIRMKGGHDFLSFYCHRYNEMMSFVLEFEEVFNQFLTYSFLSCVDCQIIFGNTYFSHKKSIMRYNSQISFYDEKNEQIRISFKDKASICLLVLCDMLDSFLFEFDGVISEHILNFGRGFDERKFLIMSRFLDVLNNTEELSEMKIRDKMYDFRNIIKKCIGFKIEEVEYDIELHYFYCNSSPPTLKKVYKS